MCPPSVIRPLYRQELWILKRSSWEKAKRRNPLILAFKNQPSQLQYTRLQRSFRWALSSSPAAKVGEKQMYQCEDLSDGRVGCRQAGLSETERYMRHIPKTAAPCKHVRTQTHTHARTNALRQAAKSIFNFYPFFKKSTRLLFWWQYNNMFPRVKNEQTPTSCRKRHKKCDHRLLKNPVLPRSTMRLLLLMIWSLRRN